MEMYKYMPLPSDRMGLLWTLASIQDACILEFGPAGTTHYAVEGIGSLNATEGEKVYSTHMEEKFGIPYVYKKPYGVVGTTEFVNAIGEITSWELNQAAFNAEITEIKRYCMQLKRKFFSYKGTKNCAIYADYDTTIGLKAMLEEFGLTVDKAQVIHGVKGEEIETGYNEKERMMYVKENPLYLLLADAPTLEMKNKAKKAVQVSNPNLETVLTFPYTPFVGTRGVLWMVQQIYNA